MTPLPRAGAETGAARPYRGRRGIASVAKIAVPAALVGALVYIRAAPFTAWTRFQSFALAFALAVCLAVFLRGRWRDAVSVVATLLLCLAAIEAYCVDSLVTMDESIEPGFTVAHPVFGWARGQAGVFHHVKREIATGRLRFDAHYTIDANLNRQVVSDADGPTVAFYGGSDTFGIGLDDAETLPQQFADAIGRRARVLNFGVAGYGSQQFLRALETGIDDAMLRRPRLIVNQTIPWQAERIACVNAYMRRAPRYVLAGGDAAFRGVCAERWSLPLRVVWEQTSLYSRFVEPRLWGATPEKVDLYIAVLARAGRLAREKYGAETAMLYTRDPAYLRSAGLTDDDLMRRLRDAGLVVIDDAIDLKAYPGQTFEIAGESHPNGAANRIWAARLAQVFAGLPTPAR